MAGLISSKDGVAVEDLGRKPRLAPKPVAGGRQLVIDLLPFGVSVIRVDSPKVALADATPYPSEAVLTSMEAKYQELSNQLARLNRGGSGANAEPPNPGFEQEPTPTDRASDARESRSDPRRLAARQGGGVGAS